MQLIQQQTLGHQISRAAMQYLSEHGGITADLTSRLNPHPGPMNCPATAAAGSFFFDQGRIAAAPEGTAETTFEIRARFGGEIQGVNFYNMIMEQMHDNSYIVVRGTRNRNSIPHHFFVVARYQGEIYVVDSYSRAVYRGREAVLAGLRSMNIDTFSTSGTMRVGAPTHPSLGDQMRSMSDAPP